jgi:hypothetical protein
LYCLLHRATQAQLRLRIMICSSKQVHVSNLVLVFSCCSLL